MVATLLLSPQVYEHDVLLAALPTFLLATAGPVRMRLAWTAYALIGWFVLYLHFNVLATTSVNVGSLWLFAGLALAIRISPGRPVRFVLDVAKRGGLGLGYSRKVATP